MLTVAHISKVDRSVVQLAEEFMANHYKRMEQKEAELNEFYEWRIKYYTERLAAERKAGNVKAISYLRSELHKLKQQP